MKVSEYFIHDVASLPLPLSTSHFINQLRQNPNIVSTPPSTMKTYPSVQSFYKREVQADKEAAIDLSTEPGDGFTKGELSDALDPLSRKWNPEREYEELNVGQLVPGPHAVTFVGRIVNLSTFFGKSPRQPKAAGFHSLIVKDDFAAISVCLYVSICCIFMLTK